MLLITTGTLLKAASSADDCDVRGAATPDCENIDWELSGFRFDKVNDFDDATTAREGDNSEDGGGGDEFDWLWSKQYLAWRTSLDFVWKDLEHRSHR